MVKSLCCGLVFVAACVAAPAQSPDARVQKLLQQMTLAEKVSLLHGAGEDATTYQGEAGYLPGIPRLGIVPMRFADGPPGILTRIPALAPPSTMALAATWSGEDAEKIGVVIGQEARARGISVALEPFINIDRDFRWDRAYNTFGEDPELTAVLGAAEVRGIQGTGVMAQAKHFLGYDTESRNVFIDEQTLHEVYLRPFAAAIAAGVSSLMCSYNRLNGAYACGNASVLTHELRDELHFPGFVTSDWGATHATTFLNAGLDMEMPGPLPVPWNIPSYFVSGASYPPGEEHTYALNQFGLPEEPAQVPAHAPKEDMPSGDLFTALRNGSVTEADITQAAGRVLMQMERFGRLDGAAILDPMKEPTEEEARVLEQVARDGAVLLRNRNHALPLTPEALSDLAVIGPTARQVIAVGQTGEKAVGIPAQEIGPLAALKTLAGAEAKIRFAVADDMEGALVPASALSHGGKAGLERRMWNENAVTSDTTIHFTSAARTALPADSSAIWTGTLHIDEAGVYQLHFQLLGCIGSLSIDDKTVAKTWFNWIHGEVTQAGQDNLFPTLEGLDNMRAAMPLSAGDHAIRIEIAPDTSHAPAQVSLRWVTPAQAKANFQTAVEAARHAKAALVFAWSRNRPVFALPGDQNDLIAAIAAVNPHTIVVLNTSQPVALPWLEKVEAVLQMGWPGDRGGVASAQVLLGLHNPGGHLPYSWPVKLADMPANDPRHPERSAAGVNGRTIFSEGLLVGYRWLDRQGTKPLFPFGYGDSYTTFHVSGMRAAQHSDGSADVILQLENTGNRDGDAVVQLYADRPKTLPPDATFAEDTLVAFARVTCAAHAHQEVHLQVSRENLAYWSTKTHAWALPKGSRTLWAGFDSRDREAEVNMTNSAR